MGLVSKETLDEVKIQYTDEELKERETLIDEAEKKLLSYGLKWTFRAISYLVNYEKVSLNSLRSMIFLDNGSTSVNLERACHLLLTCGLISSRKIEEKDYIKAHDEAFDLMEDWISSGRHLAILHCLIINRMTSLHFFTDSQDSKSLDGLALKNIEKSLALRHLAIQEEVKMQEIFNYSQI